LKVVSFGGDFPSQELPLPTNTLYVHRPAQSQIASIYASCDVWLFGSRIDSFGLPILESMACRTPVIGVPVGAAPELLTGGAGVLIDPESPTAMAKAIVTFFRQSPENWAKMSQLAYDRAHSYTWDDATDRFEQLLESCVPHH
jgi:glycosyltransferase involved in cell wall biosynthesis